MAAPTDESRPSGGHQGAGEQGASGQGPGGQGPGEQGADDLYLTDEEAAIEDARRQRANRACRGALAALLCLEAFVVLLVPRAIARTDTGLDTSKTVLLLGFAVVLVAVGAKLRAPWGIAVGSALQIAVLATGFLEPVLFVIAACFIALWLYVLNLRHQLVGTPGGLQMLYSP